NKHVCLVYHARLLSGSYASKLFRFWSKTIIKHADHILCVSKAVYQDWPESSKKKIVSDALPAEDLAQGVKKSKRNFIYLYVGNFIPGKGQNYAIEAMAKLPPEFDDAKLIFVGGDLNKKKNIKYKNSLKSKVKRLDLDHQIKFESFRNQIELKQLYQKSHVVLNFSESESFSMVCLEALMYGTPVISSRCGGPEEIVEHMNNGLLVDNKDVGQMADAMTVIKSDESLRRRLTENTSNILQKYSLRDSANKLTDIYLSCYDS
ncbi:MAG: glycosyltransferase family 4 protein, partial [Fulvivirga sp.]|nr:glycosyltransferase family 4 protein [Fulvivirga sp.]